MGLHLEVVRHGLHHSESSALAKGFVQRPGRDYGATYAPVTSLTTVRCLLAIAAARGYIIWQCDVKNAFLHGDIDRDVYIQQPPGFTDGTSRICKLRRALYGLKQSPRCWYTALQAALLSDGFHRCAADKALFFQDTISSTGASTRLWLVVYVDDLLLVSACEGEVDAAFTALSSKFHLKRILPLTMYLGIEIERDSVGRRLFIHQRRYIQETTEGTHSGTVRTPLTDRLRLDPNASSYKTVTKYLSIVGKISYAAHSTRPDLAWAHSWLARGNTQHTFQMFQEAERAMIYMKGTAGLGLLYQGGEQALRLEVFSDASYQAGERGQTGWIATLGGAAVAWKSGRQSVRSDSSCAAEFRAAKAACREIIWLRFLLEFMQCPQPGVPLGIDNRSALCLLNDADGSQTRCKDLCRDFAMIHDWIHIAQEVIPRHVAGKTQPADFLTKQLGATA